MSKDQLQDVADGTSRVLGHNGNRVSLVGTHTSRSSLAYYEHTPRPSGGAYKNDVMKVQTAYSKDPIGNAARERAVFAERKARTIANADKHSADQSVDPAVRKKMEQKRENALATERWTVASDSKNPLAATFSHESGHTIMAQGIDSKTGMTIRSKFDERMLIAENLGHVTKQHKFSVSAYGATSNSEMFAEVTSAIADGRPHLVPKGILDVYNATLENYSIVK
jgi:hypothetical protein